MQRKGISLRSAESYRRKLIPLRYTYPQIAPKESNSIRPIMPVRAVLQV
jgi:hypothetical protein